MIKVKGSPINNHYLAKNHFLDISKLIIHLLVIPHYNLFRNFTQKCKISKIQASKFKIIYHPNHSTCILEFKIVKNSIKGTEGQSYLVFQQVGYVVNLSPFISYSLIGSSLFWLPDVSPLSNNLSLII